MRTKKVDPYNEACPSRYILDLIGSKWAMLLVCSLRREPMRTGALKRRITGISQKMLTQTLRELERHGIVQRIDYAEVPPRVEYRLTRLGRSLAELVAQIEGWIIAHHPRMQDAAENFDAAPAVRPTRTGT